MSGVDAALLNVGRAVVTPLFTRWLGGRRRERERTLPLSSLLRQKATDEFTRRRGEREIEAVVDEVGERLKPLIRTRFAALPPHEVVSCMEAVADTFNRADLTDDSLFAVDLDPARLKEHLGRSAPPAGLSDLGERLYEVALEDCARCFTQFVVQTAPFTGRAQVEIMSRLSEVTEVMSAVMERLVVAAPALPGEFLPRYRDFLSRKLNALELVGLDTQFRPQTAVSVAYISLAVSGDNPASPPRLPLWDPTLLRHAHPDEGSERVEQALARRTRTLIRGEAGAGKSTLLRWLAITAAADGFTGALADWNGRVPFLIKLRSWSAGLPAPEQFLTGLADPIAGTMPSGWVHEQLRSGRALLLVDGVDELAKEIRPRVRAWLRDLLDAYPEMLMVVTSRPPAAPVRWLEAEGFEPLTLERLSPADVRALIYQWHQAAHTSPSLPCQPTELYGYEQALVTQLAANKHLYRLAGNPLLAAMLCALNLDRRSYVPTDRMSIYQAAVDMMLHRRDKERGVHSALPELTAREGLELLQDLAWRISLNNRSELSQVEAEVYLSRRLAGMSRVDASASEVLVHLLERSGLLRSPAEGRVDFVHRTFQEYLAAREAAEQNMGGLLAGQAHLDNWREIIVMAAGHGNSPMRTELIGAILQRADREPRHRRALLLLATACLETMPSLEPPTLLSSIDHRLSGLLPPRNRNEARSLSAVGDPILRRLPTDPTGLSEAQAAAVVRTAALVNGPRALRLLAGFANDARIAVQEELIEAWSHFDAEDYARTVLADAPLINGRVTIRHPGLMAAARHLNRLHRLEAEFATVDLTGLVDAPPLSRLRLGASWHGTLDVLAKYPQLSSLELLAPDRRTTRAEVSAVERLRELSSLTLYLGAGIEPDAVAALARLTRVRGLDLHLGPDVTSIDAVAGMPNLTGIYVQHGYVESFAAFRHSNIRQLGLGYLRRAPHDGIQDITDNFPDLRRLQFYGTGWAPGFAFLSRMGRLDSLYVSHQHVDRLGTLNPAPALQEIRVGGNDHVDVGDLVVHSQLRKIDLCWVTGRLDLSPFKMWKGGPLTIAVADVARISGRRELPASVALTRRRRLAYG